MLIRTLAAALATAALAVPTAQAVTPPPDMHAYSGRQTQTQDLRSPDARDAAIHHRSRMDLTVDAPGATAVDSASVVSPASAPASAPTVADDGGVDWTAIGIGIAATFALFGGVALLVTRHPLRTRTVA